MAIMYPKNITEYMPTESERIVYQEMKNQLPDSFEVFYSVKWTSFENGRPVKSEADFVVTSPEYGFLCLEVKGGSGIRIEDNVWYVRDNAHGERKLTRSPYDQAERSMYYFTQLFSNKYNMGYQGIYGAGAIFPFYSIGPEVSIDKRHRDCTIDCRDLNQLYDRIKKMFRMWNAKPLHWFYPNGQHNALMELIRERIAISAAAGALVKYKDRQLDVINRVQDNYVYLLQNVDQFYIRGGAGTGKTWIAMKMAIAEAERGRRVLLVCASRPLAAKLRSMLPANIEVNDIATLINGISDMPELYSSPLYEGITSSIKQNCMRYDAIFVDEAQDLSAELAAVIRGLLKDLGRSRLGVFYDDVQVLREDSFGDGFSIQGRPYLLHENIRNTANIYNWTAEKTKLGQDVISNPVEGPTPVTEVVTEKGQLTLRLEMLLYKYLEEEDLLTSSVVVITENSDDFLMEYSSGIAKWSFTDCEPSKENEIQVASIFDYKGLEADMVVYVHPRNTSENANYVAYTRAKYYLIEIVRDFEWRI